MFFTLLFAIVIIAMGTVYALSGRIAHAIGNSTLTNVVLAFVAVAIVSLNSYLTVRLRRRDNGRARGGQGPDEPTKLRR